jgi:hypothetical protein
MLNPLGPYDEESLLETFHEKVDRFSSPGEINEVEDQFFPARPNDVRWWFSSLQSYSEIWKTYRNAKDNAVTWLKLSKEHEHKGEKHESNIALSITYWLNPYLPDDRSVRELFNLEIPQQRGVRSFKISEFRDLPFRARHWYAWAMKGYRYPTNIPDLILNECDENFSIRTRIYRSLGQIGHPASIPILQEATKDPHPFAREVSDVDSILEKSYRFSRSRCCMECPTCNSKSE